MSIFSHFQQRFASTQQEELTLQEYLELCKQDRSTYASAAERLLLAIGEPELVETANNSRLSRIFSNKVIRRYPAFEDFHGMEECIDQIVSYFRHAAQGLEKKQILYLLGGRRRQVVPGGKAQAIDREGALLCDQGLARLRVAPGPVQRHGRWRNPGGRLWHTPALPQHHHVALGHQAPGRVRW